MVTLELDDLHSLHNARKERQRAGSNTAHRMEHKQLVAFYGRRQRLFSAYIARHYGSSWSTSKGMRRIARRLGRRQREPEIRTDAEQEFARLLTAHSLVGKDHASIDILVWDQMSLMTDMFAEPQKREADRKLETAETKDRQPRLVARSTDTDEASKARGQSKQLMVRSGGLGDDVMPFCCDSLYDYEEYAEDGNVLWRTTATWDHIFDEAAYARKDAMCQAEVDESNADDWGVAAGFTHYEHRLLRNPKYTLNGNKDLGKQFLCMFKGNERLYDCSQTVSALARAAQISPLASTSISVTEYSLYTGGPVAVPPPYSFTFPSEVVAPNLQLGEAGCVYLNGMEVKNTKRHRAEAISMAQPRLVPDFLRAGDVSPCFYNMCIVAGRLRYDCFDMMMGSYAFTMADYADKFGADKTAATHGWANAVINSFVNPRAVHYNIESSMCTADVIVQRLIDNYERGPLPSPESSLTRGGLMVGGGTYKGWYDSTCIYVRQALESVATFHDFWDLIEDTAGGEGGNMCRLYTKEALCHMADWCHDIGRRLAECECGDRMHGFGYVWFLVSELYYVTTARWGLLTARGDGHEPLSYHSREPWLTDGTPYWTTDVVRVKEARTRLVESMIGRTCRDLVTLAVSPDVHPEMQNLMRMWGSVSNRTFAGSVKMHYHMSNAVAASAPLGVRRADVDWRTWVEVYNALSYEVSFNPSSPYRCVTSRYAEVLDVQFRSKGRISHAINTEVTDEYACYQRNSGGTAAYVD
ncbi:hypothetical protein X797_012348 [Metarhizium robertsii]|uniref:Uncharacterized protein n=2 Tax=Metarhizium robertsii TaxID=568076 RepID=E9FDK3_METRA|nr:uncharacterized protein MAA_10352 [Metarhizium robertsii ARSEF 23]EFY94181.1 hypothetical protein MAA_10352 [Metarhizium robertsii ARSEF 23]EXU94580.1 hypothetical protein X797_012348 [Metarhizium robertsii]